MTITIDTTYGDIPQAQAIRMADSVIDYESSLIHEDYPGGATEAWISNLVASLLKATGTAVALETGAFMGHTTVWLARALQDMGGGTLHVAELDTDRAVHVSGVLTKMVLWEVDWTVHNRDALAVINDLPDGTIGLAFLDDDHGKDHVAREIEAIWPKMAQGGIITGHDMFGVCDLQSVFRQYGGYALDFPRCGPAGGLGILQVR